MRLIDADALIKSLKKKHEHFCELCGDEHKDINYAHYYAVMAISDAPTIELKELVTPCGGDCDVDFDEGVIE